METMFHKFSDNDESDIGYDMNIELDADPDRWIDEILERVMSDHPYLAQALTAPEFEKWDEDRRDAVGHIIARSGDTVIQIPVIIHDGKMFPLDTYVEKGQAYPLTEARIARTFFSPDIAEAVVPEDSRTVGRREYSDGLSGETRDLKSDMGWKNAMPTVRGDGEAMKSAMQSNQASHQSPARYHREQAY